MEPDKPSLSIQAEANRSVYLRCYRPAILPCRPEGPTLHGGPSSLVEKRMARRFYQANAPQYLPDYVYRVGVIYNWRNRVKVAFMGTFIGSSFADASNTSSRFIPTYDV